MEMVIASSAQQRVTLLASAYFARKGQYETKFVNPSDTDGFPLELFVGVPWSQYLASLALDGTYGDQLTLQSCFQLQSESDKLTIVSSLGADAMVHIFPQHSPPVASFALGHFSEEDGIHYVSLARLQEE